MTIPQSSPTGTLGRALGSPRLVAAWALLGYAALFLFVTFIRWVMPDDGFLGGADFTNLVVMAMPVAAFLLAVHVQPQLPAARLITIVALVEYAFALVFGFLAFLTGLGRIDIDDVSDGVRVALDLVMQLATLGLVAVAGYVVLRAFMDRGTRLTG
jgi:hypothetical protein